jgi:hypothetical protein
MLFSEFSPSMPTSLLALLITLGSILRSRLDLQLEILALRHQIGILERSVRKRPRLTYRSSPGFAVPHLAAKHAVVPIDVKHERWLFLPSPDFARNS